MSLGEAAGQLLLRSLGCAGLGRGLWRRATQKVSFNPSPPALQLRVSHSSPGGDHAVREELEQRLPQRATPLGPSLTPPSVRDAVRVAYPVLLRRDAVHHLSEGKALWLSTKSCLWAFSTLGHLGGYCTSMWVDYSLVARFLILACALVQVL
jgi:hypothetical protein